MKLRNVVIGAVAALGLASAGAAHAQMNCNTIRTQNGNTVNAQTNCTNMSPWANTPRPTYTAPPPPAASPYGTGFNLMAEAIKARAARREAQQAAQQAAQDQQARQEAMLAEVTAFAADPRHPYFQQAREQMRALLSAGRVQNLQDAYDLATVQLGLVH